MNTRVCLRAWFGLTLFLGLMLVAPVRAQVSDRTEGCLICHEAITPGIVADWRTSRHSEVTPAVGLQKPELERRISAASVGDSLANVVVGCAECHTLNAAKHQDSFEHQESIVHAVVSPADCAVCHPHETGQYQQNLMSFAHINLAENDVYMDIVRTTNGTQSLNGDQWTLIDPEPLSNEQACFYCHGTKIENAGTVTRTTVFGELEFADLKGWPNQGVGRINGDGSRGSCSACHARHAFSIEVARKPYTCSECHKGPDVPGYKIYSASKMGNIYSSLHHGFDFDAVPWSPGRDFTSPTCATCHVSLLVDPDGELIVHRSHQMSDRLYLRLFGLPYAHPHPRDPNTSLIRNQAGLQLPTELTGEPVKSALINEQEQLTRKRLMKKVCRSCHSSQWTDKHFEAIDHTAQVTNEMTLTATRLLMTAWEKGAATGLPEGSIFDEAIEKMWVDEWLFYANSTRLSAAMAGADYGVFDNGRWYMAKNLQKMKDWLDFKLESAKKSEP